MKRILQNGLLALALCASSTMNAQTYEWAKSFGVTSNDEGRSITVDAAGRL